MQTQTVIPSCEKGKETDRKKDKSGDILDFPKVSKCYEKAKTDQRFTNSEASLLNNLQLKTISNKYTMTHFKS